MSMLDRSTVPALRRGVGRPAGSPWLAGPTGTGTRLLG